MGSAGPPAPPNSWGWGVTENSLGATKVWPQRGVVTLPTERWEPRVNAVFPHLKGERGAHPPTGTAGAGKREGFGQRAGPEGSYGRVGVRPCYPLRRPTREPGATPVPKTKA